MKPWMTAIGTTTLALVALYGAPAWAVGGTVGAGTPASCTESAFDFVLGNAQATGGGVITFNCGTAPAAIVFTNFKTIAATIEVRGGGRVTLSGGNSVGVFQVLNSGNLTLRGLTIARGYGPGGAVENFGALTVSDVRLENNTSVINGGAIANHGNLTIENSVLDRNAATDHGGAIYSDGGKVELYNVELTNNVAGKRGGAVAADAGEYLQLNNVRIAGNQAAEGGGIRTAIVLVMRNGTFVKNSATSAGGAVYSTKDVVIVKSVFMQNFAATSGGALHQQSGNVDIEDVNLLGNGRRDGAPDTIMGGGIRQVSGTLKLLDVSLFANGATNGGGVSHGGGTGSWTNVTLMNNSATKGSAIDFRAGTLTVTNGTIVFNNGVAIDRTAGTLTFRNTAIVNDSSDANCAQPLVAATFSLSSDGSCGLGGGRDNVRLDFDDLGFFNGGFTLTLTPAPGNPMIDGGSGAACPEFDQRGSPRPAGLACDVGAVEVVAGAPRKASAFEYYNASFGHYFVTKDFEEMIKLDDGTFTGWVRTGLTFDVFAEPGQGRVAVCRFFTVAFPPKSSHFYAPMGLGCEGTRNNPDWVYEGDVFYTPLPSVNGECPAGTVPIYRLYNNGQGGAPNHRFTTSLFYRDAMIAQGYVPEGSGIGVGMCSPA